jgi:hypothetical protein
MPRRELLPVRPETLVDLGAEGLKIAAGVVLHLPGGLVAKGLIGAGQKALKQEQDRRRRDSAIGSFVAEATYLQGDLIRIADFVRRTAPDTSAGVPAGSIVAVSSSDRRQYRELLTQLLGRIGKLDASVLEAAEYLTDDERGLVAQDLSRVRELGVNVLCEGREAPLVERVGRLLEARGLLARVVEGLS